KFSPAGNLLWYKISTNTTNSADNLGYVTVDTSASIVATGGGADNGSVVFGYTISTSIGKGNPIYFIDANTGNLLSAITGTVNNVGGIYPRYTDHNNNFHCSGEVGGTLKFGANTYTAIGWQSCIAKLNTTGVFTYISMLPQSGGSGGSGS